MKASFPETCGGSESSASPQRRRGGIIRRQRVDGWCPGHLSITALWVTLAACYLAGASERVGEEERSNPEAERTKLL